MRTVYVNGEYLPEDEAKISVFDRGFLMADAVYEVTAVLDGKLCDFEGHRARLHRSLSELDMKLPVSDDELLEIHREMVRRNELKEGGVYLQVTRGEADRDFVWPKDATPGMVLFTQSRPVEKSETAARGIRVVSVEDQRWGRRDIKTVQLLFPSWAKMQAKKQGADDAWLVEDGFVTEGTSNNAYIVRDVVFAEIVIQAGIAPPLDAILAFAPGGQAEMVLLAIIAGTDVAYVVTHHLLRIVIVILGAPFVARWVRPRAGD